MNLNFDLQYFADAGTLVNGTENFPNAAGGTPEAFDSAHTLSPELKAFYDTELLENARTELFYAQFAKRQPLPKNHKGQVEWRKWNTFDRAAKLTEGVIPTGQKFGVTTVTGAVDQYGTYTSITDKLELRAYDDVILGATEEMGASAAETQEKLIRDALLLGTNVLYCDNITLATGAVSGTPSSCAQMEASATAMSLLTPAMMPLRSKPSTVTTAFDSAAMFLISSPVGGPARNHFTFYSIPQRRAARKRGRKTEKHFLSHSQTKPRDLRFSQIPRFRSGE